MMNVLNVGEKKEEKKKVTIKVVVDFILLLICAIIIPLIWNNTKPTRQGFFCDDESIMYPAKASTISNAALWSFCLLVPTGIICLTEVIKMYTEKGTEEAERKKIYLFQWEIPYVVQQIYTFEGVFLIGLLMSELSNDFIKSLIGRPRPNFLELCKPDFNCSSVQNPHHYVADYKCTNPHLENESYIRQSFPSGHAALTTYAMFYVLFYLQKRMTFNRYSVLAKPLLFWMLLMPAGYISLSRIRDNMHHWDDILGGFFLGFFICVVLIFSLTDLYAKN